MSALLAMPPRAELRRRLPRLFLGLTALGVGLAAMVRADLGLGPWEVLHQGVSERVGLPIGTVGILTGAVVLLLWVPMMQRPGVGTLANVVWVGVVIDLCLLVAPDVEPMAARIAVLACGVVLIGIGSGLYIGSGLGAGPRDGLMTGLAARGHPVGVVRTAIEITVLVLGWLLGGSVGIGTVVFAVAIGPLVQLLLPRLTVSVPTLTAPAE